MSQDTISLDLQKREVLGKAVKHLRKEGQIPAVIHDHGKPSLHVQGDARQMLKVWREAGKHHPVEIKADGKSYMALIKDADFDPRKHLLTHVVFNAVDKDQKVDAEIPVKAVYDEDNESSPAERSGLIVLTQLENVEVKAVPQKLPDFITYNAEKLVEVGDQVTVADLKVPEGVVIETDPNHSVATVFEPSALAAANDAAGGGEEEAPAEASEEAEGEQQPADAGSSSESEPKTEQANQV